MAVLLIFVMMSVIYAECLKLVF